MSYPTPMDVYEAEDKAASEAMSVVSPEAQLANRTAELVAVQSLLTKAQRLLAVYRFNTPLGYQPPMLASEVDEFFKSLDSAEGVKK